MTQTESEGVYKITVNKNSALKQSSFGDGKKPVVLRGWISVY
ncbi:hypothetical protein LP43_1435 [Methylophaga thiooxydans]|uniref:Uncharacterized protein n=1 Tax=Methylophaga thiooxydans TaxID=392484 RepID=A0A0A0BGD2_9GAMM|nr:hypothetical protein LP43_1435 [Methylophaga thiooxydans]